MGENQMLRDDIVRTSRDQAVARLVEHHRWHAPGTLQRQLVAWLPIVIGGMLAGWAMTRRSRLARLCVAAAGAGCLATTIVGRQRHGGNLALLDDAEYPPLREEDDLVDEASAGSFPASDPPATRRGAW
jgi:hypothetical protein